ncbi:hypothetical protein Tco_0725672 [Tanacetum coccineum]|uniref:Uncharacterized protein n=1 Tax=Tanacetum coccineum TaxID=301880 RepID=A0ABQ4YEF1_9ASTR
MFGPRSCLHMVSIPSWQPIRPTACGRRYATNKTICLRGYLIRQRHVDNDQDPEVSTTSELFALANGPSWTPISINSCVVDDDYYYLGDEDALPHDLANFDVEDLINVDDDGVEKMSTDVARSHGGDGGGDDRPPSHVVPTGCGGCFANRGKGRRKPNLGGRGAAAEYPDKPKPFAKGDRRSGAVVLPSLEKTLLTSGRTWIPVLPAGQCQSRLILGYLDYSIN